MAKIYHYLVGYDTHEGGDEKWLASKKRYSQVEFDGLCISVAPEATRKYVLSLRETDDKALAGQDFLNILFERLYEYIAAELVESCGFQYVKPHGVFSLFGWSNIVDPSDWPHRRCKNMEEMRKVLVKAGFGKGFGYTKTELLVKAGLVKAGFQRRERRERRV